MKSEMVHVIGPGIAATMEIAIFHPMDTMTKRLMNNRKSLLYQIRCFRQFIHDFGKVVLIDSKLLSLYPGLGYGAGYKLSQRVYKFGLQPYLVKMLRRLNFDKMVSHDHIRWFRSAVAGAIIGIGEVSLLPLDNLKIKMQTNPLALKNRSFFRILSDESFGLFQGSAVTALRNSIGSFALFGVAEIIKEKVFQLSESSKASVFQTTFASTLGSISCLIVANPFDVVKTRTQSQSFGGTNTAFQITRSLFRNEGPTAFYKGFFAKIVTFGPKLAFAFTVSSLLIDRFSGDKD